MYMIYYLLGFSVLIICCCILSFLNKKNKQIKNNKQNTYNLVSDGKYLSWKLDDKDNVKYKLVLKDYISSDANFIIKDGYCDEIKNTYIKNNTSVNDFNVDNMIVVLSEYNPNDWFELVKFNNKYMIKLNIFSGDYIYLHKGMSFESEINYKDLLLFDLVKSQN